MVFFSPLEQFEVIVLIPKYYLFHRFNMSGIWFADASITNITIYFFIIILTLEFFFRMSVNEDSNIISNNWYFIVEILYNFIANLILQQTGHKNSSYVPLFPTIFLFVLIANLIGLLPFGYTVTGQIIITFTLAFSLNIAFFILGCVTQGYDFINLFIPKNAPMLFKPLIFVIEIVSYLLRTFSLSIRLFANMMAGHTLLHILTSFRFVGGLALSFMPWLLVFAVAILEFAIAFIQAYVFTILSIIYLNDAINIHAH